MIRAILDFLIPQRTLRDPALDRLKAQREEARRKHRSTRDIEAAIYTYQHDRLRGAG